jgi:hypothetical protein
MHYCYLVLLLLYYTICHNSHVRAFYGSYFADMSSAIYSSTFNIRCIFLKPTVLAAMAAFTFLDAKPLGKYTNNYNHNCCTTVFVCSTVLIEHAYM